jgi:hypothetical protein
MLQENNDQSCIFRLIYPYLNKSKTLMYIIVSDSNLKTYSNSKTQFYLQYLISPKVFPIRYHISRILKHVNCNERPEISCSLVCLLHLEIPSLVIFVFLLYRPYFPVYVDIIISLIFFINLCISRKEYIAFALYDFTFTVCLYPFTGNSICLPYCLYSFAEDKEIVSKRV